MSNPPSPCGAAECPFPETSSDPPHGLRPSVSHLAHGLRRLTIELEDPELNAIGPVLFNALNQYEVVGRHNTKPSKRLLDIGRIAIPLLREVETSARRNYIDDP
jgi:hypothetical protein